MHSNLHVLIPYPYLALPYTISLYAVIFLDSCVHVNVHIYVCVYNIYTYIYAHIIYKVCVRYKYIYIPYRKLPCFTTFLPFSLLFGS